MLKQKVFFVSWPSLKMLCSVYYQSQVHSKYFRLMVSLENIVPWRYLQNLPFSGWQTQKSFQVSFFHEGLNCLRLNSRGFMNQTIILSRVYWFVKNLVVQGQIQRFWKGGTLYVGYHGWPEKKNVGFRRSKKVEITLETITFWQNISINIFKSSQFLSIKSYQIFKIY